MALGARGAPGRATSCIVTDFLDTKVLVHAFDGDEPTKQASAQ